MRKRSSKKSSDPTVIAFEGMQSLLEKLDPVAPPEKNPAAVAFGKLGGAKGGKARAAKLSAKKRKEIAKKAAKARWGRR